MDWLEQITKWFKDQLLAIVAALGAFCHDIGIWIFKTFVDISEAILDAIPVPDFVSSHSLNSLFASAGPMTAWIVDKFQIGTCLGIIGAGVVFRLIRKLFTLGQW